MAKRHEIYSALRDKGLTYEEIGKIYGVSRQAVWDVINNHSGIYSLTPHAEATIRKVRYEGLMNWMLVNRVRFSELEQRCGGSKLFATLTGKCEPRKKTIDAILKATGLTYEECFTERQPNEDRKET